MELARARAIAEVVVKSLRPFCYEIAIAGSIRRERPEVGDIDIVAMPRLREKLIGRVKESCAIDICGQETIRCRLTRAKDFQLEIWLARPAGDEWFEPYPTNWGAVLLCRTGSMQHNIQLCEYAQKKGLAFNPYRGLVEGSKVVASATEKDIYEKLGLSYLEPTKREVLFPA